MKNLNIKKSIYVVLFLLVQVFTFSQSEGVSIKNSSSAPDPSAMLDVESSTKGILIPRVTLNSDVDFTSIQSPANSLLVFNTSASTTNGLSGSGYYYFTFLNQLPYKWIRINTSPELWTKIASSNHINYFNGNVRIGSDPALPTYNFEIIKPSSTSLFRFQSTLGELKFTCLPISYGTGQGANVLTQSSALSSLGHYSNIIYEHIHPNGNKGFRVETSGKFSSNFSAPGIVSLQSFNNELYINSGTGLTIGAYGASYSNYIPSFVYLNQNGSWTFMSDSTFKRNIKNETSALSKILLCRPVSFKWKAYPNGDLNHGFISQEIEAIFPELVSNVTTTNPIDNNGPVIPRKTLNYTGLISVLTKAIQEQQAQIELLKTKVAALENR
jgi:hypothetical protein